MNEALLLFIWQHSLYDTVALRTAAGEPLTVIAPGRVNTNAGPDLSDAKIKVGDTILVGNVELHVRTSDWYKHGHQHDAAYRSLALHVVYEHDAPAIGGNIPTLELKDHIPAGMIARYSGLMTGPGKLPCGTQHSIVRDITKEGWMSRLLAERWEQKLAEWDVMLSDSADDWRNLLYWRMAANFGFKTNATPFLMLARSLPLNVATRHKDDLMQLEALFFGQAGMLDGDFTDDHPRTLQREYEYLRKKYKLHPIPAELWKFMRMRPVNFPSVRIAQFAALVHRSVHLFSQVIESHTVADIRTLLDVKAGEYWDTHYRFDVPQDKPSVKTLGKTSVENIIINTIAPIQFLYAARQGTAALQERSLQLLESVPAEQNHITALWEENNWTVQNAAGSQALIQLYNNYCSRKRCLDCTIGLGIMRRK
ncbi:DUF2851 family protein [Nemorincola caseinilytica]